MILQKIEDFKNRMARVEMARAVHAHHHQGLVDELGSLEDQMEVLVKSSEVLKKLLNDLAKANLQSIDRLVTEGLRRVFYDQVDIKFISKLVERNNQLQIGFETKQGPATGKAVESFGASVTVVESLLLRIIVVLKMGLAPVLLLDESLAQVSDHYVEPLGKLIQRLCKDLGLKVLLVTHQQGFQETADVVYRADCIEGPVRVFVLKKVKSDENVRSD